MQLILQAESSPEEDARCSKSERAYIEASTVKRVRHSYITSPSCLHQAMTGETAICKGSKGAAVCRAQRPAQEIPWRLLLSKAPVWALIVCHFCHNWGTFILLTWMPTYYNQVRCQCRALTISTPTA